MNPAERDEALTRLDRGSRQNVGFLHQGKLTEEELVSRMETIRAAADRLLTPSRDEEET